MFKFISKIFPSKSEKDVKELFPLIGQINEHFEEFKKLSDEELRQKAVEFKEKIKAETEETEKKITDLQEKLKTDISHQERQDIYAELNDLDKELQEITEAVLMDILPEAFAAVKDACRRLCGTDVCLHRHRSECLRRRDVDDGSAGASEVLEDGAAAVEGSEQVDIDDCLESISGHSQSRSGKVSGCTANQNVDFAMRIARRLDGGGKSIIVADIGRMSGSCAGRFLYLFHR